MCSYNISQDSEGLLLSDAINPVLEALRLTVQHNFEFLEAVVRLHLAHLHVSGYGFKEPDRL